MLHNIGLHIFSTTFDKLPSTAAATGVKNRRSTAELETPALTCSGGWGALTPCVSWGWRGLKKNVPPPEDNFWNSP